VCGLPNGASVIVRSITTALIFFIFILFYQGELEIGRVTPRSRRTSLLVTEINTISRSYRAHLHPSSPPLSSLCSLKQVKVALGQKAFLEMYFLTRLHRAAGVNAPGVCVFISTRACVRVRVRVCVCVCVIRLLHQPPDRQQLEADHVEVNEVILG